MLAQFRQRLATGEAEIPDDEIARPELGQFVSVISVLIRRYKNCRMADQVATPRTETIAASPRRRVV
jgi:hypothetical protein